jgi:hypothetical protein
MSLFIQEIGMIELTKTFTPASIFRCASLREMCISSPSFQFFMLLKRRLCCGSCPGKYLRLHWGSNDAYSDLARLRDQERSNIQLLNCVTRCSC